jgi:hypothetical protein
VIWKETVIAYFTIALLFQDLSEVTEKTKEIFRRDSWPTTSQIYITDLLTKTNLRGRNPQANYTDRATAACRRS